jgi:hypothetical protein
MLKPWKNRTYGGLALLAVLVWTSPVRVRADTTAQKKTVGTAKPKPRTTSKHHTQKASTVVSQHRSAHHSSKRHVSSKAAQIAAARRRRAQLRPEPERIEEIQQALVKAGYLNAQPNGRWNDETRDAMRHYQVDHGFAVTGLPEAKSLMKLGLGPHPLPPDLDTSNGARASTETDGGAPAAPTSPSTPATPDAQQDPPTTTTPP